MYKLLEEKSMRTVFKTIGNMERHRYCADVAKFA